MDEIKKKVEENNIKQKEIENVKIKNESEIKEEKPKFIISSEHSNNNPENSKKIKQEEKPEIQSDFEPTGLLNYICSEVDINSNNISKDIRIINSFEEFKRENKNIKITLEQNELNEEEIKKNCDIYINGKKIPFSYFHKFDKEGTYKIIYSFKNKIKNLNAIFAECNKLTKIDFSKFDSKEVINTAFMFLDCALLTKLTLSNFITMNVTNMKFMFFGCKSLLSLDLSNFITSNVTNMEFMFYGCDSLSEFNLSKFNTEKVENMAFMFCKCCSLNTIDTVNLISKMSKIFLVYSWTVLN